MRFNQILNATLGQLNQRLKEIEANKWDSKAATPTQKGEEDMIRRRVSTLRYQDQMKKDQAQKSQRRFIGDWS